MQHVIFPSLVPYGITIVPVVFDLAIPGLFCWVVVVCVVSSFSCVIDVDTYVHLFYVKYHVIITRAKKSSNPRSPLGPLKQPFRDENTIFFENESKSPASNSNGNKNISFENCLKFLLFFQKLVFFYNHNPNPHKTGKRQYIYVYTI